MRGTGEDKEREGKGRDACRDPRRDEVHETKGFGAGYTVLSDDFIER